jgi:hypothetical protein
MHRQRPAAIPWYAEEDFPAIQAVMTDEDIDFPSWSDWLRAAEELEAVLHQQGRQVVRIFIEPQAFADFCHERGVLPDAGARSLYVRLTAKEQHGLDV